MRDFVNVATILQKKKKNFKSVSRKIPDETSNLGGLVEEADQRQRSRSYSIRIIIEETEDA